MRRACVALLLTLLYGSGAAANGVRDDLERFLSDRGLAEPAASQSAPPAGAADPDAAGNRADRMSELVVAAMGSLGVPYRRGGNTYDSGYDCSGFVRAIYEQYLGRTLPRQAAQQAAATEAIERDELQPGDLVFFNTLRRAYSHVGIYVGDHKFIHSPKPGGMVRIEDMRVNYWNSRFDGARRVAGPVRASLATPAHRP